MKRWISLFLLFSIILVSSSLIATSNNTYKNSNNIPINGLRQTQIFNLGSDNYINFIAQKGSTYVIETFPISDQETIDTTLTLYDTDGTTELAYNDDINFGKVTNSRIIWEAPSSGKYYVKVSDFYNETDAEYEISATEIGNLVTTFLEPTENINVKKNSFFNVTAQIKCVDGICTNNTFFLDPEESEKKEKVLPKSKIEQGLLRKFNNSEKVSVIVVLKDSNKNIQQNQEKVISTLSTKNTFFTKRELKIKHEYNSINAFAGEITLDGLKKLEKNSNVKKIYLDKKFKINLDNSIPFINADRAWDLQYNSVNITGKDETICILDTGINYSHPDFGVCSITSNINDGSCPKVIGGYNIIDNNNNPLDDNGHGTHVSAIAASQGEVYRGVAPDAKIVAVKVMDSGGYGSSEDIMAGIDWCITNKENLNITVISMSLGDGIENNDYCNDVLMASSINEAIAEGIIVTVAAGNERFTSGISSPACVQNSTAVGTVNNNDEFDFNRGAILDIVAPGKSIVASDYEGGHITESGTSMSTPHVAGLASLVSQYGKLRFNRTLQPFEIEHIMKYNSVRLFDSGSGFHFPRIDAYAASNAKGIIPTNPDAKPFYTISSNPSNNSCLDYLTDGQICNITWTVNATGEINSTWEFFTVAKNKYRYNISEKINITIYFPSMTLDTANNSIFERNSTLNCTAFSLLNLTNITLYTDINGSWNKNQTFNVSGITNSSFFNLTDLNEGAYKWNCLAKDSLNNNIWNSENYTFKIDNYAPIINYINKTNPISLGTPQLFQIKVTDAFLSIVNISIDGQNITLNGSSLFNYSRLDYTNGTVNFTIYAIDESEKTNSTTSSYFVNDTNSTSQIYSVTHNANVSYEDEYFVSTIILDSYNLTKVYLDYNGTNFSIEKITFYNYSYSWENFVCGINTFNIYVENELNYSTNFTSSFLTLNCCGNDICDSDESCSSCSEDCGQCPTISTTSSSGGGGGGGASGPTTSSSFIITDVTSDEPIMISVTSSAIPIKELEINVKETQEKIKVNIESLEDKPEGVSKPKTKVFNYLEINAEDLISENIKDIKFSFTLSSDELGDTNPENIALAHYVDNWDYLKTDFIKIKDNVYYFESESTSFSYFAIVEKEIIEDVEKLVKEEEILEPENETIISKETRSAEKPSQDNFYKGILLGIFITLILFLILHKKIEEKLKH